MSEATSRDASRPFNKDGGKKKSSLFGKFNKSFQDAIEDGRGEEALRQTVTEVPKAPAAPSDDIAVRSAKAQTTERMTVPDGVVIGGTLTSSSETQISGRVDGDVTVEATLSLSSTCFISGKVRAATCTLQGKVDGNLECTNELVIGQSGNLNADAMSGKDMTIAGKVTGNVQCGGVLRLMKTANLTGNIRARSILFDEGATFNGTCSMSRPNKGKPKS